MAVALKRWSGKCRTAQGAGDLSAGATSLSVSTGGLTTWSDFAGAPGAPFNVVINRGLADEEHLYATAVSGDSLTGLVRGKDDTTDQPHVSPFTVEHGLFAEDQEVANLFLSLPTTPNQVAVSD